MTFIGVIISLFWAAWPVAASTFWSHQPSHSWTSATRSGPAPTRPASCQSQTPLIPSDFSEWSGWGGNIYNNRWASDNSAISLSSVESLTEHCRLRYPQGVSATPTINGDIAYYPTWSGLLVALNYKTCTVQWQLNLTAFILAYSETTTEQSIVPATSRTSPQVDGDVLYVGTLRHAVLLAVDKNAGTILGHVQINPHPLAELTMSPTVYDGRILIGASSDEEAAADIFPDYACCSFAGNMVALTFDRATFTVAWNVSMLPSPAGNWSGAAIWGSQPSIDIARSQVFIATGNVYTLPTEYTLCQNQSAAIEVVASGFGQDPCLPSDVYQESVLALDLATGLINWANQLSAIDAWTVACGLSGIANLPRLSNCPPNPGPDADFGMAPSFIPGGPGTPYGKDTVVVGQKNGNLYALSAQAGRTFWTTVTSPDGFEGGLIWGVAVDAERVYFAGVNAALATWQLQPSNKIIGNSAFGAASLVDGSLLWETQAPMDSVSLVPPSVVNDVVFFGRTFENDTGGGVGTVGGLVAVDKVTGNIARDVTLDAAFHGGIAIQDGFVLFGSGYNGGKTNGSFYVMSV